jgi:hypothetical protein
LAGTDRGRMQAGRRRRKQSGRCWRGHALGRRPSGRTGGVAMPHRCGSRIRRFDEFLDALREVSAGATRELDSLVFL